MLYIKIASCAYVMPNDEIVYLYRKQRCHLFENDLYKSLI